MPQESKNNCATRAPYHIDKDSLEKLRKKYDTDGDGILSDEEIRSIEEDYEKVWTEPVLSIEDAEIKDILDHFDPDHDGHLDMLLLKDELDLAESNARYAGYALSCIRIVRYTTGLAMHKMLRKSKKHRDLLKRMVPTISSSVVIGCYVSTIGYFAADMLWEIYKLEQKELEKNRKISEALMSVPLLAQLTDVEISRLADAVVVLKFNPGDKIVVKGTPATTFFIIKKGKCAVSEIEAMDLTLGAGEFFGERALIQKEPRSATVTAKTEVEVLALDKTAFDELLGPLQELLDRSVREKAEQHIRLQKAKKSSLVLRAELNRLVIERATHQAIASMIIPMIVINGSHKISTIIFNRIGRFQKWGPSLVAVSIIPFLPYFVDEPVKNGVAWAYAKQLAADVETRAEVTSRTFYDRDR